MPLPREAVGDAILGLALDAVAAEVVGALTACGIPSLVLKGPAIAAWLYQEGELRAYNDVDLLVAASDQERARRVLAGLGFSHRHEGARDAEHAAHAEEWVRESGYEVDLHVTLPLLDAGPDRVWAALSAAPEEVRLGNRVPVAVARRAGRALVVLVQAVQQGRAAVRSSGDLARLLTRMDMDAWHETVDLARDLGAEEVMAAGLRLVPEGAALADRLGLPVATSPHLRLLAEAGSPAERFAALRWERLARAPGVRGKLRLLRHELLPSRTSLITWASSPSPGRAGLAAAYVRRAAVALRGAPVGYRRWRAARGTAPAVPRQKGWNRLGRRLRARRPRS